MQLNVTLSPESISELKSLIAPQDSPLFGPNLEPDAVAEKIMENHGDDLVNGIVDQQGDKIVSMVIEQIDVDMSEVASNIDMSDLAREIDIDVDEVGRIVADNISASDIAREMADEVDLDDVASRIMEVDHDWSQHINHKQVALQLVTQFINNSEFRNCFMDTLLSRLSETAKS